MFRGAIFFSGLRCIPEAGQSWSVGITEELSGAE